MFEVYFVHVREDLNERETKEAKDGLTTELNRYSNDRGTITFMDDYFGCPENNLGEADHKGNETSESEVGPNQFQVNGVIKILLNIIGRSRP